MPIARTLPFVPVDFACERLVLGWRIVFARCPRTPLAMTHAMDASLYGQPAHQHIARALWSIDAAGEVIDAESLPAALTLTGHWERVGGWRYLSKLVSATDGALSCEVEAATERLLRLMERRAAVEHLVELAEGRDDDRGSPILHFVRERDRALQSGASGAEWRP